MPRVQRTLVLASSSLYRQRLLKRLGLPFESTRPEADETPLPGESFERTAIRLAELHWKRKDMGKMLEACQRALELDTACESAHQMAMRAYAARGDRAAIARQYQACRQASESLFGLPPAEETEKLYRQLIA